MVMITVPHSSFLPFLFALFSFTPFPLSELFAASHSVSYTHLTLPTTPYV